MALRLHLKKAITKRFIVAAVVVSLLASSVAGQKKYERPAVKTPDTFRGADPVAPTDQTSIGDLKWFEVFKDEELQKLVRTAMVQNYDLRAAVARINAARANLGLARSNSTKHLVVAGSSSEAASRFSSRFHEARRGITSRD